MTTTLGAFFVRLVGGLFVPRGTIPTYGGARSAALERRPWDKAWKERERSTWNIFTADRKALCLSG